MKATFFTILVFLAGFYLKAQPSVTKYRVSVSFNSACCGVPSDKPLVDYIKSFKKKNKKSVIVADKTGPLGREGEYAYFFLLKELSPAVQKKFIAGLNKLKFDNSNSGSVSIQENVAAPENSRAQTEKIKF